MTRVNNSNEKPTYVLLFNPYGATIEPVFDRIDTLFTLMIDVLKNK